MSICLPIIITTARISLHAYPPSTRTLLPCRNTDVRLGNCWSDLLQISRMIMRIVVTLSLVCMTLISRSHTPPHTLRHTLTHSNTYTFVPNSPSRLLLLAPVVTSTTTLNPMSDVRQMSPTSQSRDGSTDDASPESTRFFEIETIQNNAFECLEHNVCV